MTKSTKTIKPKTVKSKTSRPEKFSGPMHKVAFEINAPAYTLLGILAENDGHKSREDCVRSVMADAVGACLEAMDRDHVGELFGISKN